MIFCLTNTTAKFIDFDFFKSCVKGFNIPVCLCPFSRHVSFNISGHIPEQFISGFLLTIFYF